MTTVEEARDAEKHLQAQVCQLPSSNLKGEQQSPQSLLSALSRSFFLLVVLLEPPTYPH